MKRLASILVWSAISAAFIGPGTVTTAARAGAGFGLALLWAVVLSDLRWRKTLQKEESEQPSLKC